MVKCQSCSKGLCKKKYENRHKCDDPSNCTCTCQEPASDTFWKSVGSIALGTAAFAGGVVLTVSTGGLGAVGIAAAMGGGALTGVGATAVIHPVAKQIEGERMTGEEYAKDLVISGTIGVVTGPIGLGGASVTSSLASKVGTEGVKRGAIELGGRAAVGAVSGATASAIQEGVSDKEFSVRNVLKGAALGAATGGASQITGFVANKVDPGVVRSVTKVVADTACTAGIDATCQLVTEGSVDPKKLALNAGARAATSAGYEAVAGATYKFHGGKDALQDALGDDEILDKLSPEDREAVLKGQKDLQNLPSEKVAGELTKATRVTEALKDLDRTKAALAETKSGIKAISNEIRDTPDNNRRQQLQQRLAELKSQAKVQGQQIRGINQVLGDTTDKIGKQNIHALDSKHVGQFAADLPNDMPTNNNENDRGLRRVVYDAKVGKGGDVRYKIAGVTETHNYDEIPLKGQVAVPELIEVEPFVIPKDRGEEDEEEKKKNV